MKDSKKISLLLGSHAHVPSGSSDEEFKAVYNQKTLPFITNLYRYSNIQAVLHYSGVFWYWIERNHHEFFMLIDDMVSRKQIEILGGGFYEPCFPLIPVQDRIGQIEFMTTYLRKHFGKRPQGCWMPDFVWEQHLMGSLTACDMLYTFLSQDQFKKAGLPGSHIFSPCLSEDQGKLITVFPVSTALADELSVKSFSQVFNDIKRKLHSLTEFSGSIIPCVFPDKILSSPGETEDSSWNRFFEEVSLSESIVETTLPSKVLKNLKIFNKGSFNDSPAFSGDFSPRRNIIEHGEANGIYSKMQFTNLLINQLKGDKYRKTNAREELWKAQDSSLYSHGNKYLRGSLRKAAYTSLLRAERLARDKGKFITSILQYDFDFDGVNEYLFQDSKINCYIQLKGAGVFELDYLPKDWNYLDCGCDDIGRRTSFSDIIASPDEKIIESAVFTPDNSRLCYKEMYTALEQEKKGKACFMLPACSENIPFNFIEIMKCYLFKKDSITVSYTLKNTNQDNQNIIFIPRIHFSFEGISEDHVRFFTTDAKGDDIHLDKLFDSNNLKILDVKNEVQIIMSSSKVFNGCFAPVYKNDLYQAVCFSPGFPVNLKSGETWTNEISLKFSH